MPELPEVETTLRGLEPHICGLRISNIEIREPRLRWPVTGDLHDLLKQRQLLKISRRAKYLLFQFETGYLLIHLGMSGSLRLVQPNSMIKKHDHVDFEFDRQWLLRLTDPRRFGAVLWLGNNPSQHPLLQKLGPEPLSSDFNGKYLYAKSEQKKLSVKQFIMDQTIVTGVGNIYASEALYKAGILPTRAAGRISQKRYNALVDAIKTTLAFAIQQGGTTLRDFVGGDGKPGYFQQQLNVYGRSGKHCKSCGNALVEVRISNRSSVFCRFCQT